MKAPTLRPLRGYEPAHPDVADIEWLDRWTTPRPVNEPQVKLKPAEPGDDLPFHHLLTKILEVLDGRRPIGQLQELLTDVIYEATLTRLRLTPAKGIRYQLHSVHSCRPTPEVVELCGRVETRQRGSSQRRAQAVVARLEKRLGVWRCAFLRLL